MNTFSFKTVHKKLLSDIVTPVSIYLRLRDVFPCTIMLESSDYHGTENSMSYICFEPIAGIILENNHLNKYFPDGRVEQLLPDSFDLIEQLENFKSHFKIPVGENPKFINNGLFGYFTYETIQHFETIRLKQQASNVVIPQMQYHIYRYIIAIDHAKSELHLFENNCDEFIKDSQLERIVYLIQNKDFPKFKFQLQGEEKSNFEDEEFKKRIIELKKHVQRGNVFQIVFSRSFSRTFLGDEFNVYRALRSINPSPYLFYFDYGNFRLFGSSPEAQITIKNKQANIYPIAGTIRRTGSDSEDAKRAEQLSNDAKETAEHVMLVDLARNDLSRHCQQVNVKTFKEIQFYSHVIHLVSQVSGIMNENAVSFKIVGDTFPAGTLSGAPKYRAMELIDEYERGERGFYSGAIGYMGFDGDFNHAIMIRSFLSYNHTLHYQAGAGIVLDSTPENELKEVNNKIAALRKAMEVAETI